MDSIEYLVVGAGVSGLSFANWLIEETRASGASSRPDLLVVEADEQPGGYCKTVVQDGFVWDFSGHFFHFRDPAIDSWLRQRMPGQDIRTVIKRSFIRFAGQDIDFPFQKNIHQLPRQDFIDCLVDLYFRDQDGDVSSFKRMLYTRFGASIAERFLIPYNEKLYACDLDDLDPDAMGRFFPHADIADIIGNMRRSPGAHDGSYNATFSYPLGGAIQYIHALLRDLPDDMVSLGERLEAIDLDSNIARTSRRTVRFRRLISSAPLPALAAMCGVEHERDAFAWNRVRVYNLGFDRKGASAPHWMYFPDPARSFYRVGWYDNIMDSPRMSLYVEIGEPSHGSGDSGSEPTEAVDEPGITESVLERVLDDLRREGIVDGHRLVSWHSVVLDPAYVHITARSRAETERLRTVLARRGVHSVGRYGGWTYCSIEDNMIETRALARDFAARFSSRSE